MKYIITFLSILGLIGIILFFVWTNGIGPTDAANTTNKTFTVRNGEGVREIAEDLKTQGLITNPDIFYLYVKLKKLDAKIQAGDFQISPAMSADQIAKALQKGSYDIRITIPEGKRADEIADILQEQVPTYQEGWRQILDANEGYLFPDTYSFSKDVTIDYIVKSMKDNFEVKYATITDGNKNSLTREQLVIIASLVEREARFPEDRALVASVIFNRLKMNMALQIDAAVQYGLGYQTATQTWWKKDLTADDLKINSPYNTYINTGLPPTPICNPGLDVLKAVIEAPETNYLYYVSDKTGHNHYSATFEEHKKNIEKYGV